MHRLADAMHTAGRMYRHTVILIFNILISGIFWILVRRGHGTAGEWGVEEGAGPTKNNFLSHKMISLGLYCRSF